MGALPTEPTYSTHDEFKANTRVTSQKTIDEADWKPQALHAEFLIDSYVNCVESYSDTQARKFPEISSSGDSDIPVDVKKAHIEIVSWLLLKGEPSASDEEISGKKVSGESWSSTGYSKNFARSDRDSNQNSAVKLPPIAIGLLAPWYTKSAQLIY
jgi:hypothetical protein